MWAFLSRQMHCLALSLLFLAWGPPAQLHTLIQPLQKISMSKDSGEIYPANPLTAQQNTGAGIHDPLLSELLNLAQALVQETHVSVLFVTQLFKDLNFSRSMCVQALCQTLVWRRQTNLFCQGFVTITAHPASFPELWSWLGTADVTGALTPNHLAQLLQEAGTQIWILRLKSYSLTIGQRERHSAEEANKIRCFIPSSIDHFSRSVFALDCKIKLQRLPEQINGQTHPNNTRLLHAHFIPEHYPHPHLEISRNQGESPEHFIEDFYQFNWNFI